MANCSVLEAHQKPTDKPTRRIKRSGGHSLVSRGVAVWIVNNVLLRLLPAYQKPPKQEIKLKYRGPRVYQHHIEPKIYKVDRRQMEELERWYASVSGDSL